jgi:hypothetical protein
MEAAFSLFGLRQHVAALNGATRRAEQGADRSAHSKAGFAAWPHEKKLYKFAHRVFNPTFATGWCDEL